MAKDATAKPDVFTFVECTNEWRAGQGVMWTGSAGWHFTRRRQLEEIQKILPINHAFMCACGSLYTHTCM